MPPGQKKSAAATHDDVSHISSAANMSSAPAAAAAAEKHAASGAGVGLPQGRSAAAAAKSAGKSASKVGRPGDNSANPTAGGPAVSVANVTGALDAKPAKSNNKASGKANGKVQSKSNSKSSKSNNKPGTKPSKPRSNDNLTNSATSSASASVDLHPAGDVRDSPRTPLRSEHTGSTGARPAASMSDIPMEYMTPDEESDKEVAIKGRRRSAPMLNVGHASESSEHLAARSVVSSAHDEHATKTAVVDVPPEQFRQSLMQLDAPEAILPASALLPPPAAPLVGRKCLVLDLDETLVHSSFKYLWNADFVIPVEIEGMWHDVYVVKRPGVDEFLERVAQLYEVVVFTASVAKYGDPLLDHLDANSVVHHRLFRESCANKNGTYVKELSVLGRPLQSIIIIDNSPAAYSSNPHNAIPVSSWFSDVHDSELMDMLPFLEDLAEDAVPDVINILRTEW